MKLKQYRISIFIVLFAIFAISTFWTMQSLAFIIFLSTLFSILLKPMVDFFSKKLNRTLSAIFAILIFISVFIVLISIITQSFLPAFTEFLSDAPNISKQFYAKADSLNLPFLTSDLDKVWNEIFNTGITALKSSLGLVFSIFNKIIDGVVIVFVTFYIIQDHDNIKNQIINIVPDDIKDRIKNLIKNILTALHAYIKGQLIICINTGFIVFLYYMFRDIPYAPVFAVISAVAEFIPVLGPTIASVFGILITLTISPILALQTAFFYLILTQVNHNVIYPTIIGKTLNLHPITIILSIILGGELMGAKGMFLAVPIITICKIIITDIYEDYIKKHTLSEESTKEKEKEI